MKAPGTAIHDVGTGDSFFFELLNDLDPYPLIVHQQITNPQNQDFILFHVFD